MKIASILMLPALGLLTACATVPVGQDGSTVLRLGQSAVVDGPRVTPLRVVEDSRCPANARCIWAGRVRVLVRITLGNGSSEHELTMGQPIQIADGQLELTEVRPARMTSAAIKPADYRFGFRFSGGL